MPNHRVLGPFCEKMLDFEREILALFGPICPIILICRVLGPFCEKKIEAEIFVLFGPIFL